MAYVLIWSCLTWYYLY